VLETIWSPLVAAGAGVDGGAVVGANGGADEVAGMEIALLAVLVEKELLKEDILNDVGLAGCTKSFSCYVISFLTFGP
jgi:hypothetical protein